MSPDYVEAGQPSWKEEPSSRISHIPETEIKLLPEVKQLDAQKAV